MYIREVTIKNLYNKNFHLKFNQDVTFLYGINGCGKTTILNIISSIISGKLTQLHNYKFDFLRLIYSDNENRINELIVEKEGVMMNYHNYKVMFSGISCSIPPQKTRIIEGNEEEYAEFIHYNEMKNREEAATQTTEVGDLGILLRKEFRAIYLPLTRKDGGFERNRDRYIYNKKPIYREETSLDTSIRQAVELVKDHSSFLTHADNRILERLKEGVLSKALDTHELTPENLLLVEEYTNKIEKMLSEKNKDDDEFSRVGLPQEQELKELIAKIMDLRSSFSINEEGKLSIRNPIKFANYSSMVSQLYRVNDIVSMVNNANENRRKSRLPLTKLFKIVNGFLKDGHKELFIEEKTRYLRFRTIGTNESTPIHSMSSGEKQIVIFFIHILIGLSDKQHNGIFIIDEPELSLHIDWQHKFVMNIMDVSPGIQLIFATHSPEIIGELTNKCEEVRGEPIV